MKYEITIGIECHVQLATKNKLFSEVDNDARGKEPNSCVSHFLACCHALTVALCVWRLELATR